MSTIFVPCGQLRRPSSTTHLRQSRRDAELNLRDAGAYPSVLSSPPVPAPAGSNPNPPPDCQTGISASPLCCWPSSSPGPRNFKSASAILKPSFVSSRIFSRACASAFFASEIKMQKISCAPRPMRPRNWCNCASPNASAFSIEHHRRVRHVHADFDQRGRQQRLDLVRRGNPPSPFLLRAFQPPVQQPDRNGASSRLRFSNSFVTALRPFAVSFSSTRG